MTASDPSQAMSDDLSFQRYRRKQIAELRPYQLGEVLHPSVSVSAEDKKAGSPRGGDMIARNPKNHADQWLVAADYFSDNFEPLSQPPLERTEQERALDNLIALYAKEVEDMLDMKARGDLTKDIGEHSLYRSQKVLGELRALKSNAPTESEVMLHRPDSTGSGDTTAVANLEPSGSDKSSPQGTVRDPGADLPEDVAQDIATMMSEPCSICSGDCASANPPVIGCPVQARYAVKRAVERLAKSLADEQHGLDFARRQFVTIRDHGVIDKQLREAIGNTINALDLVIAARQRSKETQT